MSDRVIPLQRVAASDRADPEPARIAGLLAQIGTLGERIDAAAQRSVAALRQACNEPGVATWNAAKAESLLELAAHIGAERRRLDAALERDRARLGSARAAASEPGVAARAAMDPGGPTMI